MKKIDKQQLALDNLQFIAERLQDGKEFIISGKVKPFYYFDNKLNRLLQDRIYKHDNTFGDGHIRSLTQNPVAAVLTIEDLMLKPLELRPALFSQDELVIIRSLRLVNWLVRDQYGHLTGYINKPYKSDTSQNKVYNGWKSLDISLGNDALPLKMFNHMFLAVEWADTEPTYIGDLK